MDEKQLTLAQKTSQQMWNSKVLIPESFRNNENSLFLGVQTAISLGCKTQGEIIKAMGNMYVVKGCISLWGDLPLAIAKQSGRLESFEEYFIDSKHKKICIENKNVGEEIYAGIIKIKEKGKKENSFFLTAEEVQESGALGKNLWKQYYRVMFKRRLRRIALFDTFPEMFAGLRVEGYDDHLPSHKEKPVEIKNIKEDLESELSDLTDADLAGESEEEGQKDLFNEDEDEKNTDK